MLLPVSVSQTPIAFMTVPIYKTAIHDVLEFSVESFHVSWQIMFLFELIHLPNWSHVTNAVSSKSSETARYPVCVF